MNKKRTRCLTGSLFGKQLGCCVTVAYNRVGVESVLSLSMTLL